MEHLGWADPIEAAITLVYRRSGKVVSHEFAGGVWVEGEKVCLRRDELPLKDGRLDLTHCPVVGIGGKRKAQPRRGRDFLDKNPDFQGALLFYPGTGNWDLGEGMLMVTSREILAGRRVSGGKAEVQLTNHRWLRDGSYVADRCRMLHGKVLKTLETAVEQIPGAEAIAKQLASWSCPFVHRLQSECRLVADEIARLEMRRVNAEGGQARYLNGLLEENILAKLQATGVECVADIPVEVTVSAAEIAPELVAHAETIGTIEIPGLGRRLLANRETFKPAIVEIALADLTRVTDWPHVAVGIRVPEFQESQRDLEHGELHDLLFWTGDLEVRRWPAILGYFARRWARVQRQRNYPKDVEIVNPRRSDLSVTPEPVVWGSDLITGEEFVAYAGPTREGRPGCYEERWRIRWYDSQEEAVRIDVAARQEAESYIVSRRLEAELAAATPEELQRLRETGEILVNWGGHFREMGRTGNAQFWVVRPDGTERLPDEVEYRKRYASEGEKRWRFVGREELAITWSKGCSAASHVFVVAHLPVGGPTPEQLAFVAELEEKIAVGWEGVSGISGRTSPPIGGGWGLN